MRLSEPYIELPPGVPNPYRREISSGATYTRPDFRRQQQQQPPPPGMPSSSSGAQQPQQPPYGYAPPNHGHGWNELHYDRAPTSLPPGRPSWGGSDSARPPSAGFPPQQQQRQPARATYQRREPPVTFLPQSAWVPLESAPREPMPFDPRHSGLPPRPPPPAQAPPASATAAAAVASSAAPRGHMPGPSFSPNAPPPPPSWSSSGPPYTMDGWPTAHPLPPPHVPVPPPTPSSAAYSGSGHSEAPSTTGGRKQARPHQDSRGGSNSNSSSKRQRLDSDGSRGSAARQSGGSTSSSKKSLPPQKPPPVGKSSYNRSNRSDAYDRRDRDRDRDEAFDGRRTRSPSVDSVGRVRRSRRDSSMSVASSDEEYSHHRHKSSSSNRRRRSPSPAKQSNHHYHHSSREQPRYRAERSRTRSVSPPPASESATAAAWRSSKRKSPTYSPARSATSSTRYEGHGRPSSHRHRHHQQRSPEPDSPPRHRQQQQNYAPESMPMPPAQPPMNHRMPVHQPPQSTVESDTLWSQPSGSHVEAYHSAPALAPAPAPTTMTFKRAFAKPSVAAKVDHTQMRKFFPGDDEDGASQAQEDEEGAAAQRREPASAHATTTAEAADSVIPGLHMASQEEPQPRTEPEPSQQQAQAQVKDDTPAPPPLSSRPVPHKAAVLPTRPEEVYERLSQVGEGTYGKVYKARNTESGSLVALKRIRMEAEKDGFPITSVREIKLLQSLRHPNVVALSEMMVSKGGVYMVFEYLEHDLTGVLRCPDVTFTHAHCKSIIYQLLSGLSYIHDRGILHRDLKGSNILLSEVGSVKIADFGLARFYARKGRQYDHTNRVITQWYKPPELLYGATMYGAEVDVWSAGCIFLELFTRRPVFQGQDEIHQLDVIYKLLGTPKIDDWPEVAELPWYELVKPKDDIPRRLGESFGNSKWLSTSGEVALADALLALNPSKRPTAEQALRMPYFTSEEPRAERPTIQGIGEWHEWEAKIAKAAAHRKSTAAHTSRQ